MFNDKEAFFVDIGIRKVIHLSMIFYELPEWYWIIKYSNKLYSIIISNVFLDSLNSQCRMYGALRHYPIDVIILKEIMIWNDAITSEEKYTQQK